MTTAYLITSTISTPLYGKLSDIFGRKPMYLTRDHAVPGRLGARPAFANSMYELAAFRAVQGLGAGGLMSLALAIIADLVSPRERSKYQGYFMAVWGTSSVLGPVIGGFFAGAGTFAGIDGWRWVFLVNVPVGIVGLIVVAKFLNVPHTRVNHRVDYWGAGALTARAGAAADHRRAGPRVGLGLRRGAVDVRASARSGWSRSCWSSGRWATRRCCRCGCSAGRCSR